MSDTTKMVERAWSMVEGAAAEWQRELAVSGPNAVSTMHLRTEWLEANRRFNIVCDEAAQADR